jgi:VWFA-related protein
MKHTIHGQAKAGHFVLAAALVAAAVQSPILNAQNPQGPPSVTFQVEVNYVDVDAVVTDEKGNFITGLTRDDFEVFEDGKPQKIDMFSYVEIPVEKTERFLAEGRPIMPDAQSNRQAFAGRLFVIVLDDQDISVMRTAHTKKAARQFVEEYMGANDVAAVIHTSGRTDAAQEFTSNKQLLLNSIDKFVGRRMRSLTLERLDQYYQTLAMRSSDQSQSDSNDGTASSDVGGHGRTSDPSDFERGFRALGVLDTLKNASEFLASVRGRRKAVVFFSEGIDYPITDLFGSQSASDVIRATRDAVSMAARANVNYFTIDPRGLVGMTSEFMDMQGSGAPELAGGPPLLSPGTNAPITSITGGGGVFNGHTELMHEFRLSQDSLRTLAEETGGIASVNSNSLTSAFERIVEANSRYYVLGYYPPTHPRDGRFHKIEVRVKRPGLKVLARKGYASPRGRTVEERKRDEEARRAREARRPDADKTSAQLRDVLFSPMQQSGLTFTVQAAPFKNTPKEASVALAIELDGDRLQFAPPNEKGQFANKIELSFFSLNEQGKALAGTRTELDLTLRPETHDRVKAHGVRVNPRINLAPGRYQVRIGARDSVAGQTGSVFYDLDVPDFRKEKLMVGGLLLTTASVQQTPSIQPDPVVAKLLPAPATSRRAFPRSDTIALYTEIYDNITSKQPRRIEVAVRLLSETGTEVFVSRDELTNGLASLGTAGAQGGKAWDTYGYAKGIPLKELPPGRYLLRVETQVRGDDDVKPATRETLITIVQ